MESEVSVAPSAAEIHVHRKLTSGQSIAADSTQLVTAPTSAISVVRYVLSRSHRSHARAAGFRVSKRTCPPGRSAVWMPRRVAVHCCGSAMHWAALPVSVARSRSATATWVASSSTQRYVPLMSSAIERR